MMSIMLIATQDDFVGANEAFAGFQSNERKVQLAKQ